MAQDSSTFTDVIDTLFNTFSGVIEKDVIAAVVVSYEGDRKLHFYVMFGKHF